MLNLSADVVDLTAALVDIPSESRHEQRIADEVEVALGACSHLSVTRFGNTVVARTQLGRDERVVLGGHLDTVPAADNLPHHIADGNLYGLGANDMKGGVAVALRCAYDLVAPSRDVTYVFYECEEIDDEANGLRLLAQAHPELIEADFAVLMEPSNAGVEAGCQGTLRAYVRTSGSVPTPRDRGWAATRSTLRRTSSTGSTPTSRAARSLTACSTGRGSTRSASRGRSDQCHPRCVCGDRQLPVRAGPLAGAGPSPHAGGVRRLPDRDRRQLPRGIAGPVAPAAAAFLAATGSQVRPKFGWTDVSRFSALGIPAVNFGPGDPSLAHTRGEYVPIEHLRRCEQQMIEWLR